MMRAARPRAYRYRPTLTEAKASGHALRDLVDRMFGGSSEELVMSLVKTRQSDADKLAALTRRVQKEEQ